MKKLFWLTAGMEMVPTWTSPLLVLGLGAAKTSTVVAAESAVLLVGVTAPVSGLVVAGDRLSGSTSELAPWFCTVTSTDNEPPQEAACAAYPVTESSGSE